MTDPPFASFIFIIRSCYQQPNEFLLRWIFFFCSYDPGFVLFRSISPTALFIAMFGLYAFLFLS